MSLTRLELDFQKQSARGAWARRALLVLAVGFCADLILQYSVLKDEVAHQETRLADRPRDSTGKKGSVRVAYSDEELLAARDIIGRIAMPWDALFDDIEAAHTDGAALIAIEPDPVAGTVRLTGEARDYLRALNYVSALSSAQTLRSAHLLHHEIKASEPGRPVAFAVSASWKALR